MTAREHGILRTEIDKVANFVHVHTGKMSVGSGIFYRLASGSEMMPNTDKAIEAAARALRRHSGHPENTKFEGQPMWQSFLPEAKAAIDAAIPHLQDTSTR